MSEQDKREEPGTLKPDGEVTPIDTDYKIGQDNVVVKLGPLGLDFHNRVLPCQG